MVCFSKKGRKWKSMSRAIKFLNARRIIRMGVSRFQREDFQSFTGEKMGNILEKFLFSGGFLERANRINFCEKGFWRRLIVFASVSENRNWNDIWVGVEDVLKFIWRGFWEKKSSGKASGTSCPGSDRIREWYRKFGFGFPLKRLHCYTTMFQWRNDSGNILIVLSSILWLPSL